MSDQYKLFNVKGRRGMAQDVTNWIVIVGIGVIVISVIAIMLGAFADDLVTNTAGCNSTDKSTCDYDYNVTSRGLLFLDNATSKFGTAGTIVGVLFLLGVLGAGGFAGYSAYRKIRS